MATCGARMLELHIIFEVKCYMTLIGLILYPETAQSLSSVCYNTDCCSHRKGVLSLSRFQASSKRNTLL